MSASASDDNGPDWVRDALRQFREEVVLFVRTAVWFTLHPRRFARQWARGELHALNPLGFLATALAVIGAGDLVLNHLVRRPDEPMQSLGAVIAGACLPFVYYVLLGALQHGMLRLCGSRRPLSASCAMALYAGGGPASLAHLATALMVLVRFHFTGQMRVDHLDGLGSWLLMAGAAASFGLYCVTLGLSLAALHTRARAYQVVLANVFSIVVSGVLFGLLDPPGKYGLHFALKLAPHRFYFDLSD